MGTEIRPDGADSNASLQRVSSTACNPRHARPSTEILDPGSGTPQGHPKTAQNPLSSSQKGRLSWVSGLIASSEAAADLFPARSGGDRSGQSAEEQAAVGHPYEPFGDDGVALIVDLEPAIVHEP